MKKRNIWTLVFSLIFLFFVNTCYKEIPHIVTIHFSIDNDFYQQDGQKTYSGAYQIKVYPRQTFYEVVDGKEPSKWDWTGQTHIWQKTEYGDYGFNTDNNDSTMTLPFVYSFPWTDASLFVVDHPQNTQTIGLYDELYDIKDIYIPYKGPSAPINVTFVFQQNSFNSVDGVEDSDTVSEKREVRITKVYLAGAPISDTPAEILNKDIDGAIVEHWAASNPVSRYSQNKYGVNDLKDYGYLEYTPGDLDSEDNGIYFSFLDNAYSQVKDNYLPEGRYTYLVTDDAENGKYAGRTYVSNDVSFLLPSHDLIVRPVYKEPVEDVTYIYYDRYKLVSDQDYDRTTISYRVGRRLKSPQDLKNDFESEKTTQLYWDSISMVQDSPFENFGYEDRTRTITETQKYQLFNFRAKSENEKAYYIFAETDYDGNILPNTTDVYSDSRVIRSMNIKPRYAESGKISLIFNFSTNPDFDSKTDNTISVEEYADPTYVFNYQIGSKELKDWNKSIPYANNYPIGYGYRDYDLESGLTKGTMYLFTPATEGGNDYQFKYKRLAKPSSYASDRYEESIIKFGDALDLRHYESNGEDSIIFTPLYTPDQISLKFKHYTSQKNSSDAFIEHRTDISRIRINRGELFPYLEEDIENWIFDAPGADDPDIVGWEKDLSVESYGYVSNESNIEKWYDYNKSKATNADLERKYRFEVLEGPERGSIITLDGYHFDDLLLFPIYTADMVPITLKYYISEGSTVNTDDAPRMREVSRSIDVQKGSQVSINPSLFTSDSNPWYDPNIGRWPTDYDDYAHSLSRNSSDNYNLDFRSELKFGYRDINDNFKRYYFGSEAWYCPNQRPSFTFIADDGETKTEVTMHTNASDVQYDTPYKVTKSTTFTPKYIKAGYASRPIYFATPTTAVRTSANEKTRDDFLSKYSYSVVFIPGLTADDKWPYSSLTKTAERATHPLGYSPKATRDESRGYPYNQVDASNPDGDYSYKTNNPIPDLLYGETYISKQFFLYSLISYYKSAIGEPTGAYSDLKINLENIEDLSVNRRLDNIRFYNDYLIELDRGDISGAEFKAIFPNALDSVVNRTHLFTFHRNTLMAYDNLIYNQRLNVNQNTQGLAFYHVKDLCMNNLSATDMFTFCNLMTYNYNVQNPSAPLTYVYTRPSDDKPFGGLTENGDGDGKITPGLFPTYRHFLENEGDKINIADKNQPLVLKETDADRANMNVDNTKSGFRLPSYYEMEYVDSVVLNELVLGPKETVVNTRGNSTGDKYYNYSIFNKSLSATSNHPDGQYYYKRPIGYVLDGLMNMNGTTLTQRYKNRGSDVSNLGDVLSYTADNPPQANEIIYKKNLNHRSASNVFDPQGMLDTFIAYGSAPQTETFNGVTVTSYNKILGRMDASVSYYQVYDPTGTRAMIFGFRVCRNANR